MSEPTTTPKKARKISEVIPPPPLPAGEGLAAPKPFSEALSEAGLAAPAQKAASVLSPLQPASRIVSAGAKPGTLSTGDPATLGGYLNVALRIFGEDSDATRFLQAEIARMPLGKDQPIILSEKQMAYVLLQYHKKRQN